MSVHTHAELQGLQCKHANLRYHSSCPANAIIVRIVLPHSHFDWVWWQI